MCNEAGRLTNQFERRNKITHCIRASDASLARLRILRYFVKLCKAFLKIPIPAALNAAPA